MERRIRQRIELQQQHAQQMHFKQIKKDAEKQEEEQFRQQVKQFILLNMERLTMEGYENSTGPAALTCSFGCRTS